MSVVLLFLLLAAAEPQTSSEASAATKPQSTRVAGNPKQVRCKSEAPTGTRFAKRNCKTVDEWTNLRRTAEEDMKRIQGPKANIGSPNGS